MPRYFVPKEDIAGSVAVIRDDDAKHLSAVLRAKPGDKVEICDGLGTDYFCVVTEVQKKEVHIAIEGSRHCQSEAETRITLFQGLPKADKMELIIQKCVELGIYKIVPVATERAVVKLDKKDGVKKRERWQKISEAAAKQSGRGIVPEIGEVITFKEAVAEAMAFDGAIIPYEKETEHGIRQFIEDFKGKNLCIFIGPEGGFDEKEMGLALDNKIVPITLGKRILRTETAGMATVAILLYELG